MGFETQYTANSKFRKANDWEVNLWVLHPPISKINKVCMCVRVCVCACAHRSSACWYVSRFGFLKSKSWDMDLKPNDFEERQFQKALWDDGKVRPGAGMVKSKECTNYHYEKLCFSPSGNPLRLTVEFASAFSHWGMRNLEYLLTISCLWVVALSTAGQIWYRSIPFPRSCMQPREKAQE